tara:strand:+ start:325 stop:840 length:516 start_codon:yes stop_codon:yes gene_type:complete
MNQSSPSNWFVAQYKPNAYFLAKRNLEMQGLKTFLPLVEITKRKNKSFSTELKPLFPGYIFISFNLKDFRWSSVNNTVGLTRLIVSNNTPQSVPEDFINDLKLRCDYGGKLLHKSTLQVGKKVEVMKGPFTEMIGSIESIHPKERITLLFEILGRKTKISFSTSDLKLSSS